MVDIARLGVIGLGWFGGELTKAAATTGLATVTSCYSRSEDRRQAFADAHGVPPASSLEDLLDDPAIDGVFIATPHTTHVELIERAAAADKHVFVEKPLALTVADARRAIEATERAGVTLQIGHNRRRQPANRRIASMIRDGELGTVVQLEGNQSGPGGHNPDLPEWRTDPSEVPAGGMTALGVHIVDTFHSWVGPAVRVTAMTKRVAGLRPMDDATTTLIEYESGPLGYIGTSYFTPAVNTLVVFGTDANVWNEEDGKRFFLQPRSEPARAEQQVDTLDTIVDEVAEFARCITDGATPETGPAEGIEVAAVLEAAIESAETGRAVDLSTIR
jgi:predicted dehydrogenase